MKHLNNKTLTIIFLVLVAVFVLTKIFRSPHLESNLKTHLFGVDTAAVTRMRIQPPKSDGPEITLTRKGSQWQLSQGQKSAEAAGAPVTEALMSLTDVRVQRMMSRKKSDWNTYKVGDTSGTHVTVYGGKNLLADFWIGETGTGTGPYRQNTSYIRQTGTPDVYEAATGYLSSYFDKGYDDWRDHSFLRINKNKITRINFQYPADSSFAAVKKDSIWLIGNQPADSAKMANYLNGLQSKNLYSFADGFLPTRDPDEVISIENNSSPLAVIKAWKKDKNWILSSSLRRHIYFSSKGSDVVSKLLVGKKALLSGTKK
jgi:hypothetical protein